MTALCEGDNEPPGSLKASRRFVSGLYQHSKNLTFNYSTNPNLHLVWNSEGLNTCGGEQLTLMLGKQSSIGAASHIQVMTHVFVVCKRWRQRLSYQLLEDILFINSNFKIVSKSTILLESSKLQLSEALNIVDKVSQTIIQNNNSLISEKVKCHDKTSEVDVLKSSDFPFFKYNGPEVHSASYKIEYRVFPGVKDGQSVVSTTPPDSSAEVMESMELYLHAPHVPSCLSYLILSYPILSYPILSYPILSYPILSYPILIVQGKLHYRNYCMYSTH
ncbi:hypothetical protein ANN_00655 [Periplaneta americana]|uniref:Uncharacterized protein n=1 Tax=Periplaneta americana TaxID=6978 RepID=A0ABQ8TSG9_PERAM|nr:hypothetical protein ANN_00655 [Periplaneta americana]